MPIIPDPVTNHERRRSLNLDRRQSQCLPRSGQSGTGYSMSPRPRHQCEAKRDEMREGPAGQGLPPECHGSESRTEAVSPVIH
ncbi:hypothetical protein BaRGS_00001413 [Batillaria attramentaria]|uniref:Uncharacterized protein n=1 Tax=Batillaria attramentaria TaxID=370345 RepID=A0ABD0M7K6_9CAEN